MSHDWWWLTVDALAVYRLTRLIVLDTVTAPLRARLGAPWQIKSTEPGHVLTRPGKGFRYKLWELVNCFWCVSIWIALGVMLLTRFWPDGWQYLAFLLAGSGVAGYLGER